MSNFPQSKPDLNQIAEDIANRVASPHFLIDEYETPIEESKYQLPRLNEKSRPEDWLMCWNMTRERVEKIARGYRNASSVLASDWNLIAIGFAALKSRIDKMQHELDYISAALSRLAGESESNDTTTDSEHNNG